MRVMRLDLVECGHLAAAFQREVHRHLRAPDLVRSHVEERILVTFPNLTDQDARALRSLSRNLLENAKRYGTAPVSIGLSLDTEGPSSVALWVEDEGQPLEVAERERIFEPFYRPGGRAEGQGGAGLGLSLVRDIARHHGGEIRYEVSRSGGSRFVVKLPAS